MKQILFSLSLFVSVVASAQIKLNNLDVDNLLHEDLLESLNNKHYAPRFAYNTDVDLDLSDGKWISNSDYNIWTLIIQSDNSKTLGLCFNEINMPEGAFFTLNNPNNNSMVGPIYQKKIFKSKFVTQPVKGNYLELKYYVPISSAELGNLQISKVTQGYKDVFTQAESFLKAGFGDSGNCHNNVSCPEATPWIDQIQSVSLIILDSGTRWCSGCMIGNTQKNDTPYFLTAFHCIDKNQNEIITTAEIDDIATWNFHFNYSSPDCTPSVDGDLSQFITGATLKASYFPSDMVLLELSTVPDDDFNVYYAGWDRSNLPALSAAGIHHPTGDVKKISFQDNPVIESTFDPELRWQVTSWTDGVTEGGSSGSPLFNQNGLVVGQLYGGFATCSNLADGDPTNDLDEYGKFNVSWNEGIDDDKVLSVWLDNLNTDSLKINGYYKGQGFISTPNLEDNILDIYPNPVQDKILRLNLKIEGEPNPVTINIYNTLGAIVYTEITRNNIQNYPIYLNQLPIGLYIVEAKMNGKRLKNSLNIIE